jgi:hypothetical protein
MHNPFRYRPIEADVKGDWEDNWLSNFLAWASQVFIEPWCNTPAHWSSKIANYFWAECPCCLFYRGALFGIVLMLFALAIVLTVLSWL